MNDDVISVKIVYGFGSVSFREYADAAKMVEVLVNNNYVCRIDKSDGFYNVSYVYGNGEFGVELAFIEEQQASSKNELSKNCELTKNVI